MLEDSAKVFLYFMSKDIYSRNRKIRKMTYFQVEYFQASGTQTGITGAGSLWVFKEFFLTKKEQGVIFPGILQVNPKSGVNFSKSGLSLKAGEYSYSY